MAELYAESQLEKQIEAKIQTELAKNAKNSTYTAEILRRDGEGTWWARFAGNTSETPIIVNNVDVSPGDIVYVTVDNDEHISIVNTNVSNPPISGLRAQNEFQNINEAVGPAVGLASSLAAYGITPESISSQHGYFEALTAKNITVDDLAAARIMVNDLTAENITAASITSTVGYFGDLEAENITVTDLKATKGFVADLTANNITTQNIVSDHASVGSLTASTVAITGRLDAAESSINSLQANSLTANSAVIVDLQAKDAAIDEVLANKANVTDLTAATARIGAIEADYLVAADMTAEVGRVNTLLANYTTTENLVADYATIERLEVAEADIDDLAANKANVTDLTAATARIGAIEADYLIAADMTAETARVDNLLAGKATVADLNAATGRITTLESSKADITLLESDYITAAAIDASYAQVDFSNVTASWIQNGVIKNGAISNAMINSVSANKLTAGTIDASVIDVTNLNAKNIKVEKINGVSVNGKSIADALEQHESDISDLDDKIDSEVDALNDRIDGAIETFTGTAVPTLSNAPAEDWTDYGKHVGDVYYVVNPNIPQNGYCYRFTFIDDRYSWQLIKDSDVTAALARLQTAEGNIATIQTFDQEIATFKTETESEISSLMTRSTTLETNVQTAQATANGALVENVQLWYTKADTTAPNKPTGHVESTATTGGAWTTKVPVYDPAYPHYFYCYEYKKANGDYAWSTVVHDEATCESQATARTAKDSIDNLKIGGTNLLRWTKTPSYDSAWNKQLPDESSGWFGYNASHWTVSDTVDGIKGVGDGGSSGFAIPLVYKNAVVGEVEYTLSFDYRTTLTGECYVYLLVKSGSNVAKKTLPFVVSETDWQHYEQTLTWGTTAGLTTIGILIPWKNHAGEWLEIRDGSMQLEEGNRATAWSEAQVDIQSRIDTAQATADKNVRSSIQLWYTKADDTAPAKPESVVSSTATTGGAWTTKVPVYSTSYPKYFYCWQYELADGTYKWSDIVEDKAMAEVQSTSRTAAANASSALTQVATKVETSVFNETKQTVDENSNAITTLSSVVQSTGAGVLDLFSMDIWEAGTVKNLSTSKTYEQGKYADSKRIRMVSTSRIQPGRYTVTQAYHSYWYFFRENGTTISNSGWLTDASCSLVVPDNATSYGVIIRKSDQTAITDVSAEAAASKLRLKYAYASQSDLTSLTTTVNNVSQTATSNSASITQLNTTVQNNYETVSNKFSTVEQTLEGINTSIGSIEDTLEEKADGSTLSELSARVNTVSDTVDGHTQTISSVQSTQTTMGNTLKSAIMSSTQLWYSKADTTPPAKPTNHVSSAATTGGAWTTAVPAYSASYPNYFYCYEWQYTDNSYGWSDVTRDIAMGETQERARTAISDASAAQSTANSAIKSSVQLWFTKANSTAPSAPSSHVTTNNAATANAWNLAVPTYNSSYPHYFYCYEYQKADGSYGWTSVVYDSAMTESQTTSRAAASNASSAVSTANAAKTTADNAASDASTALSTANDAASDASTALSTANDAASDASSAVNTANTAAGNASTALSTANTAKTTADSNIKSTVQLWFSKANETAPSAPTAHVSSTATTGNAWTTAVPVYSSSYPYYFYCYEYQKGDGTYSWSSVVNDKATAEMQSISRNAQTKANASIKSSVMLWFTKANATAPSKPTAQVTTNNAATGNAWNLAVPTYNATYPYYFYCYQQQKGDGTYQWSDVVYDRATTESQDTARAASSSLAEYITSNDAVLQSLQNQVDGQIEAWYKDVNPTTSNAPASEWNTDTLKARHEGDLYYNVTNGHSWRWMNVSGEYSWQQIPDSDAAAALAAAQNAQTTANGKRRIFTAQPTVPYDKGDLWVTGSVVKYATASRSSGSYTASDWATTATDDTAANAAQATADKNVRKSAQLWFTKANSTAPVKPTVKVTTSNAATGNAWNLVVPTYNASYPHYFYCYQYELADGTCDWSDVVYDRATTENQATSRSAASGVSTLTTKTNQISDTVDGHTSQITHVTKTANASGFGTIDYSAMGVWVQGTTTGETIGKTYEQTKNSSNTTRIRFDEPMPITQGVYSVTIANGYQYYTHFFDVDGHLCQMQAWTSTAEGSLTVPQDARSVAFVLRKGTGSENITPDNAAESKLRLTYAYLTEEDVSEFRSDYATFKQTVSEFNSTIGTTYATKTELSGAASNAELTKTASGDRSIFTENAAPLPLIDLEPVYGESVQDGIPTPDVPVYIQAVRGRNLYSVSTSLPVTVNGVTFSEVEGGGVAMVGTATAAVSRGIGVFDVIGGEIYTFDITKPVGVDYYYFWNNANNSSMKSNITKGQSFTATYSATLTLGVSIANGASVDAVIYPQIEHGRMLHVSRKANLIPIRSVGKNLFDPTVLTYVGWPETNGVYSGKVASLYTAFRQGGYPVACFPRKGPFTISFDYGTDDETVRSLTFGVILEDGTASTLVRCEESGHYTATWDDDATVDKVFWTYSSNVTGSLSNVQLEFGTEETEYEPYQEHVTYLDLQGNELHGLDDTYRDILRIDESGYAVIEKRTRKITIDGTVTSGWTFGSGNRFYRDIADAKLAYNNGAVTAVCSTLPLLNSGGTTGNVDGFNIADMNNHRRLFISLEASHPEITAVADLVAYLSEHPMEFVCTKLESEFIDLGYVDLPETIDGGTVYVDAEVQPVIGGSWWTKAGYSVGKLAEEAKADRASTTYTKYSDTVVAGKNGLRYNTLCMKDDEGNWTSIVNQATTGFSDKTCYTGGLQLGGILWHATNATYAAGANGGQVWESYGGIDFRYSANGIADGATTTLQLRKPLYLVGTLDEDDGLFYLDTVKWWTQDTFQEGRVYVQIGTAYDSYYAIFLAVNNPSYVWDPTAQKLVEFAYSRIKKAETAIVQTNDLIGFTATSNYSSLKEYADGMMEQEVSDRNSAISASANAINLSVSQNYASKASLDTRVHDEDTFLRRQLPSTVHTGAARIASVKGNTVRWNQNFNMVASVVSGLSKCSRTLADGALTITSQELAPNAYCYITFKITPVRYHYYLIGFKVTQKTVEGFNVWSKVQNNETNTITPVLDSRGYGRFIQQRKQPSDALFIIGSTNFTEETSSVQFTLEEIMYIDLTLMFGEGNEPATVAEFERMFPEPYYPYDPGSLLSVNLEGMKAIGFNQWDEEWETGSLSGSSGNNSTRDDGIRSKNYIPVLPNTEYCIADASEPMRWIVCAYDADKKYITYLRWGSSAADSTLFTTTADTSYIRFTTASYGYGGTYNNDICVNISDPDRNGEYEPYAESTREFDLSGHFPTGLKSAGTAYDELDFENRKAVTRIGAVDLGTLTWSKVTESRIDVGYYFKSTVNVPGMFVGTLNRAFSKYDMANLIGLTNIIPEYGSGIDHIAFGAGDQRAYVIESAYTDAATFKAAMSGVMLYYELAEPIETDISDALQSTYSVEAGGTEFVLVDEEQAAPQSAPVPFVFEYGLSAMDALADAVVRMSSAESAIVQNADNISMKVSRTDYNGQTVASLINQSPDEIKIQANHVEINGATTFISGNTVSTIGGYLSDNYDSKGSAQAAVDNLKLGGTNLLRWTKKPEHKQIPWNVDPSTTIGWGRWDTSWTIERTSEGIKGIATNSSKLTGFTVPLAYENAAVGGIEYTLSFDYRTNVSAIGDIYLLVASGSNVRVHTDSITVSETDWQHFEETFTWPSTTGKVTRDLLIPYMSTGWFEIRDGSMKLEEGNKATAWTQAPEDLQAGIDAAQNAADAASAVVTVYPTAIDYVAGTATLAVKLHVNGEAKTPTSYKWTMGTSNDSIGTNSTLDVSDLDAVYNCLCTWS